MTEMVRLWQEGVWQAVGKPSGLQCQPLGKSANNYDARLPCARIISRIIVRDTELKAKPKGILPAVVR